MIEITRLAKHGGILTKRISLGDDGAVISDGSACVMSNGSAERVCLPGLAEFSELIQQLAPHEAIALGALRDDLPSQVAVATKAELQKLNGQAAPDLIARTAGNIHYRTQQPAIALIDFDRKGMPEDVVNRIKTLGGVWPALVSVVPELAATTRVIRTSTSAGLYRTDTGVKLQGSGGAHIYLLVADGGDIDRFLRALHDRCWLAGLGWLMVGAAGQLLERSIVDRMVGAGERLVFEAAPEIEPPLAQDQSARAPKVVDGAALDTATACPPLRIVEHATFIELRAREAQRLAPTSAKAREIFVAEQAERIAKRSGVTLDGARRTVERQCDGVLLPNVELAFDDEDLAACAVADVLADPDRFVGATLADPLEGIAYGRGKAKIMRRADGSLWIHSYAHGRAIYELKHDHADIERKLAAAADADVIGLFADLITDAEIDQTQREKIRDALATRCKVTKRSIEQQIKDALGKRTARRRVEERTRRLASRTDPRPQINAPAADEPFLPTMGALNDVLGSSPADEPPARDIDGVVTVARLRRVPNMHALTAEGANQEEGDNQLPAPEQVLLARLSEAQLAEMIERHIDYIDPIGRSVHLAGSFVHHYHTRPDDDALPLVAAIATLPLVLADGSLLGGRGLDRQRGILFRIPPELLAVLPKCEDCTPAAVAEAMRFLTDEWLVNVAADYPGKCILIAAGLTIIERSLLPDRPAFWVTAGRRGGGKTTALIMLLTAATGVSPSAAAWSPNEEERRKALFSYLLAAVPAIIWDNIPRGTKISCPHIEKSCTTALYSDRRLGVSEMVAVAAAVIHFFTGNNIGPKDDLTSRSLQVRLEVDRADPENRPFVHPDPIGWTEANRAKILTALYTILLGNPVLRPGSTRVPETRFKTWWRLVGSAVEHAAEQHAVLTVDDVTWMTSPTPPCPAQSISFRQLFLEQEDADEDAASLADVLSHMADKWPRGRDAEMPQSSKLAEMINNHQANWVIDTDRELGSTLREFLFPTLPQGQTVSAKSVGRLLNKYLGNPVRMGQQTLVLKTVRDPHDKILRYHVQVT